MKGQKTGGRQAGTPNKATAAKVEEVAASGLTPLDFLLSVMRNEGSGKAMFELEDMIAKAYDGRESLTFTDLMMSITNSSLWDMIDAIGRNMAARVEAAKAAAPYVHPRLATTTHDFGMDTEKFFGLALLGVNKPDPRDHDGSNGTDDTEQPARQSH